MKAVMEKLEALREKMNEGGYQAAPDITVLADCCLEMCEHMLPTRKSTTDDSECEERETMPKLVSVDVLKDMVAEVAEGIPVGNIEEDLKNPKEIKKLEDKVEKKDA